MRTKQERAAEFARQHGEVKRKLEPDKPQDWFVRYEFEHEQRKTPDPVGRINYERQIQYELYRAWPGCPWPQAWRVAISDIVARKDLEWDDKGFVDFTTWGEFCESKELALASALEEHSSTPTF